MKKFSIVWFVLTIISLGFPVPQLSVLAVPANNPLLTPPADPLLPKTTIKRSLSPLETRIIKLKIAELDRQAKVKLAEGKNPEAFQLWYRELKLQRAIGKEAEIKDLGRIGGIAWSNNLGSDLKNISERLVIIQQEIEQTKPSNLLLLNSLGQAYQETKDIDRAIAIYQQLLRLQKERDSQQNISETLGKLYLAKFDYQQAADIYEKLLDKIERQELATTKKQNYLEQLVIIYDSFTQPSKAILVKEQLSKQYLNRKQFERLTKLKISLAEDYQKIDKLELASQNYQEAASLALSLQQFAIASDALQKLGELYYGNNRLDRAIDTYQKLIEIERKSYNYYGVVESCERLGQIYLQSHSYSQALTTFEKGLEVARSLDYKVDYFTEQIEQVKQKIDR